MPNKYIQAFNDAFAKYADQTPRAGYVPSFFDRFRHSRKLYPQIAHVKSVLKAAASDGVAANILLYYFLKDEDTTCNPHSFSRYLLDELQRLYPDEVWKRIGEPGYVVFYKKKTAEERLYRGPRQPIEDAFKNGIQDVNRSKSLSSYAATSNYSTGVSTTKNMEVARQYAIKDWIFVTPRGCVYQPLPGTYVYVIDYRGVSGVDIVKTVSQAGNPIFASIDAETKEEVDIANGIPTEDIVGAFELTTDGKKVFHDNPNYQATRAIERVPSRPARFAQIFGGARPMKSGEDSQPVLRR